MTPYLWLRRFLTTMTGVYVYRYRYISLFTFVYLMGLINELIAGQELVTLLPSQSWDWRKSVLINGNHRKVGGNTGPCASELLTYFAVSVPSQIVNSEGS